MKKFLLSFILAICMLVPASFTLIGCGETEKPHTHAMNTTYSYSIEGKGEDKKVYEIFNCTCGESEKKELTNYTIATTETAKELINTSNNTTIVLSAGNYTGETLWFDYADTPTNDLTIVGVEGTKVDEINATVHDGAKITNLTIINIEFIGRGVKSNHTEIEGLSVINCDFVGSAGVSIGNKEIKNLVVKNCNFNLNGTVANQTAIYINSGVENLTVENCSFNNIPHNAIQANADVGGEVTGDILIKNNNFIKTGSRVIYLGALTKTDSVNLVIEENSFCLPTTLKEDGNYIKLGTEITISNNNTWTIDSTKGLDFYFVGAKLAN